MVWIGESLALRAAFYSVRFILGYFFKYQHRYAIFQLIYPFVSESICYGGEEVFCHEILSCGHISFFPFC